MKRLIRPTERILYEVEILAPDGRGVLVKHVEAHRPQQAYRLAAEECERDYPGDEPSRLMTVKELLRDWPLLRVLEGRVERTPVLTGEELGETLDDFRVLFAPGSPQD